MRRFGMMIRLRAEAEAAYRQHHNAVWPSVLETITSCNIRNYSIFFRDGCLFG
ncbi:MAG: L-rhamnose mutarotase, partial [Acidobacteriaceae bacterium]